MMRRILLVLCLTTILAAQASREVEITAEPHHRLVFENAQVRVFFVDVAPHTDTLMHSHRHDYIYVMLGASEVVNEVQGKPPAPAKLQDGQVALVPGNFAHIVHNDAQPFRNLTIELLEDDKLRQSSFKWDETRGLEILHGGTKEILFVKDGIRATEFELQPGGVVPMHPHPGPHLLVAETDFDIRSDVEGTGPMSGPMPGHFMSGQVKWLPGNYSHSITNTGKTKAKFITLEFPPLPK
jgi:quercetin dioxygenase-like cupin family protein